jgi:CheY-like chemotaxis protein
VTYKPTTRSRATRAAVLVVDDEPLVRMMVADELRDHDYFVMEARSGDEAAQLLNDGAQVDLVFTDVRMPGLIDGIALGRLIASEFPKIRVIVASGNVSALPRGVADFFFSKPYDLASVVQKIETVLMGQACATSREYSHAESADAHSFDASE